MSILTLPLQNKKSSILFSLLTSLLMSISFVTKADDSVGFISGNFSVSPSGAANYSIPLELPVGINELSPSISISFNSNNKSGILGVGWEVITGTAISRCGANLVDDGFIDPADYDDNDNYCFGSSRLVLIAGNNGADGATYRVTNNINITKVVAHGRLGNGPRYFRVYYRSGRIENYGSYYNNDGSAFRNAYGNKTYRWHLSTVEDRFNNKITYHYYNSNGEHFLEKIEYGTTNIDFIYGQRNDVSFGYKVAATGFWSKKRLEKIHIGQDNGPLINSYKFSYKNNSAKTILNQISYCSHTGSGDLCLPPVSLESDQLYTGFSNGTTSHQTFDAHFVVRDEDGGLRILDLDGDGRNDLLLASYHPSNYGGGGVRRAYINTGSGFKSAPQFENFEGFFVVNNKDGGLRAADINGDGRLDLVTASYHKTNYGGGAFKRVYINTGSGFEQASNYQNFAGYFTINDHDGGLRIVDIDGDGLNDFITAQWHTTDYGPGEYKRVYINEGDELGFKRNREFESFEGYFYLESRDGGLRLGDFNGDGLVDLITSQWHFTDYGTNGSFKRVYLNNGTRFVQHEGYENFEGFFFVQDHDGGMRVVDINGDGKDDLVTASWHDTDYGVSSFVRVYISSASEDLGFVRFRDLENFAGYFTIDGFDGGLRAIDINADGLTDMVVASYDDVFYGGGAYKRVYENKGARFSRNTGHEGFPGFYSIDGQDGGLRDIDLDGDGVLDFLVSSYHPKNYDSVHYRKNSINKTNHISFTKISNYRDEITIKYDLLNNRNSNVYIPGETSLEYPEFRLTGPLSIVSNVTKNTASGALTLSYKYKDLILHAAGHGALGFASVVTKNETAQIEAETFYSQDWRSRTQGMPVKEITRLSTGRVLSKTAFEVVSFLDQNNDPSAYYTFNKGSTTSTWDLDGTFIGTTSSETEYSDDYDFPYGYIPITSKECISSSYTISDSFIECSLLHSKIKQVTINYNYFDAIEFGPNLPAKLQSEETTSEIYNVTLPFSQSTSQTRKKEFNYYNGSGKIKSEIIEPDNAELSLKTEYSYTPQGQLEKTTVSGGSGSSAISSRVSRNVYETSGLYRLTDKYNALDHRERFQYKDVRFPWLVTKITGPNNIPTTFEYNSFAKRQKENRADGTSTETVLNWCESDSNCLGIDGARYYSKVTTTGVPDLFTYYDSLGRSIETRQRGIYNETTTKTIRHTTEYDSIGRIIKVSEPFFEDQLPVYTTTSYDKLDRPISIISPDGSKTEISYRGNKTTKTFSLSTADYNKSTANLADNLKTVIYKNSLGQQISKIDDENNSVRFEYDPFGNLVRTSDSSGKDTTIEVEFDIRGRKIQMDDPNQGVWTYSYYADGTLRSQLDSINQNNPEKATINIYDKLGRIKSRSITEGQNTWTYDNCGSGSIGKICKVTSPGYQQTYTYNSLGMLRTTTTKISGQADMVQTNEYDSKYRLGSTTYPGGFKVKNHYDNDFDQLGIYFLNKKTNNDGTETYWKPVEFNARGQLTSFKQGHLTTTRRFDRNTAMLLEQEVKSLGLAFTRQKYNWLSNGNLDRKEDFWGYNLNNTITDEYEYDRLNRLTDYQTFIGGDGNTNYGSLEATVSVDYDVLGNITRKSDIGIYKYTGSGGPHAVSNISDKGDYIYDKNGNLESGDGRTVIYTSFNKPKTIIKGSEKTEITYGPTDSRYKRTDSGVSASTIYYAGAYEKEIRPGVSLERVSLGDYAILEKKNGVYTTYYTIRDHLGSLIASIKSDGSGTTRFSFDPWGKRRTAGITYKMQELDLLSLMSAVTQRGYTGHESLTNVGLIHMNGRVYDPELARFLSADPFIQSPDNLQSHNRYSYVWNNPLNNNDPSGYWKISIGGGIDIKGDTPYELKKLERELIRPVLKQFEEWLCSDECHFGANNNGDDTDIYFQDDDGGRVTYNHDHEEEAHSESRPNTGDYVVPTYSPINIDSITSALANLGTWSAVNRHRSSVFFDRNGNLVNKSDYFDDDGSPLYAAVETPWDVMNVGMGVAEFTYDVATGNYVGAVVSGVGTLYDVTAAVVPGLPGGASSAVRALRTDKGLGANPFKGRTKQEIDRLLKAKGYEPKGTDPINGKGTYLNPRTGRSYHIDADHPPPKPPHVGVGRPRGARDLNLPKARDYDL